MALNYITSLKNTRLAAVTSDIGAAGEIHIGTVGMASILATIPLANPAAPAPAGGVLTFTMPQTDASADNTGTAAEAVLHDGTGNIATGLTVGVAGTDIILDSINITAGQAVTINSASITHG